MCDALAKACYANLFDWLIHKVNRALSSMAPKGEETTTLPSMHAAGSAAGSAGGSAGGRSMSTLQNIGEQEVVDSALLSSQSSMVSMASGAEEDPSMDSMVDAGSNGYKGWIGELTAPSVQSVYVCTQCSRSMHCFALL
jgi:hypothetical protein